MRRHDVFVVVAVLGGLGCGTDSKPDGTPSAGTAGIAAAGAGKGGTASSGGSAGSTAGKGATGGTGGGATGGTGAGGRGGSAAGRGGSGGGGMSAGGGEPGGGAGDGGTTRGGASSGGTPSAGAAGAGAAGASGSSPGKAVVYIGGSASGDSYPFTTYDFDVATGVLTARSPTTDLGAGPSYIALAPSKTVLVVTNERDDAGGGLTSAAVAPDGTLSKVNHVSGSDGGFTHVAVHPSGAYVFGASYNGGSVSVFGLGTDGRIGAEGNSMDFGNMAQTHCVAFDADGTHVLVPNKGNDEVAQLLFAGGSLSANTPARVASANDAGPRHIALHPNGKLAFVINELDSTMTPYTVATNGTLTAGTSVSTLPSGFNGQNTGAHVEVSPDGKFVYGSNRGHDSIVVFSADQASGALTLVQHQLSGGQTPRDFDMDPYGRFIVVANQNNSKLAAFSIGTDGKLAPLGSPTNGPSGCSAVQIAYPR